MLLVMFSQTYILFRPVRTGFFLMADPDFRLAAVGPYVTITWKVQTLPGQTVMERKIRKWVEQGVLNKIYKLPHFEILPGTSDC